MNSVESAESAAMNAWNSKVSAGDEVEFTSAGNASKRVLITSSEARILGGKACVFLKNEQSPVLLSNCLPLDQIPIPDTYSGPAEITFFDAMQTVIQTKTLEIAMDFTRLKVSVLGLDDLPSQCVFVKVQRPDGPVYEGGNIGRSPIGHVLFDYR